MEQNMDTVEKNPPKCRLSTLKMIKPLSSSFPIYTQVKPIYNQVKENKKAMCNFGMVCLSPLLPSVSIISTQYKTFRFVIISVNTCTQPRLI